MQVTELDIPLPADSLDQEDLEAIVEAFHQAHLARYKAADQGSEVEFVMWRGMATSATPRIFLESRAPGEPDPGAALIGRQPAFFEGGQGPAEIPYYDGERLNSGMEVVGPAIIILPDTTILVPGEARVRVQPTGYFIMELSE
jgi:N-methylhydantoinase A